MDMHVQKIRHRVGNQFTCAREYAWMLENMKENKIELSAEIILHEASTVLQAALRYAKELSEVGVTDNDLHCMRNLITHVAAHSYTTLEKNANVNAEMRDLKILKEVIFRTAEMRFGQSSNVLKEFKDAAPRKSFN